MNINFKQATPDQIADYVEGTYRYKFLRHTKLWGIFYKKKRRIIRQRYISAKECRLNGECLHCGCKTPNVFYASRGCQKENPCYEGIPKSILWKLTKLAAPTIIKIWNGIEHLSIWVKSQKRLW